MQINEEVIVQAAGLYGMDAPALRLLGGMDGLAYEFDREDGQAVVLKVAPIPAGQPDFLARTEEKSQFIRYLADNGVRVARPVPSKRGGWVEQIASPDGDYIASVATRARGRHVDHRTPGEITSRLFCNWGRTTGQMHALARRYPTWRREPPGDRPQTLIGDWRGEHASFAASCRDDDIRERWHALGSQLEALPQCRECYGLVHNDLHPGNYLVEDGEITVIDFDVCCYHWFAVDIAIALFFADWGGPPDPAQPRAGFLAGFFTDFMAGYRQENTLDPRWLAQLPLFLRHHQVLLYIFFSDVWDAGPPDWIAGTLRDWRRSILEDLPVVKMAFA
jgi:Ser/Thr protein kinase RdoA (MazF antagonist)